MRRLAYLILILSACTSSAHAIDRMDTPDKFKRVVHNISEVVAYGMWFDRCLGDPKNPEMTKILTDAFALLNGITDSNMDRAQRVLNDAMEDAARYFQRVDCNADKHVLENNAQVALGELARIYKGDN